MSPPKKDVYWFKHDSNANDDPKTILLIEQLGLEGYGIYWILIEYLREQPEYKYPIKLLPSIARRFGTSHEKVKTVVSNYDLFITEGDVFYSPSLNKRMKPWDDQKTQNSLKGKESGRVRRLKSTKNLLLTDGKNEQQFNNSSTTVEPLPELEEKRREEKTENTTVGIPAESLKKIASLDDFKKTLRASKNPVGFLVSLFKELHKDAPPSDLNGNCGGRIAAIVKQAHGDHELVLSAIYRAQASNIQGSRLAYIQSALKGDANKHGVSRINKLLTSEQIAEENEEFMKGNK
jgi:hypothetical protein